MIGLIIGLVVFVLLSGFYYNWLYEMEFEFLSISTWCTSKRQVWLSFIPFYGWVKTL